jgi:tetratricopeptide (TPR) repeat protein
VVSNGTTHLVTCFGPDGSPVWEYELENRPTGVSLSPNGRFLLISCAQGGAVLFQVDFTRATLGSRVSAGLDLETARAAAAVGDLRHARELLLPLLQATPHDVSLARELEQIETGWLTHLRQEAQTHAEDGRLLDALQTLEEAAAAFPWQLDLFQERLEYRNRAVDACLENARALETAHDWEAASEVWQTALRLDPSRLEAREALASLRARQSRDLMLAGDQQDAFGDLDGAVIYWQQALALEDSEELRDRLLRAEVGRCMAAGIAFYEAQRMPEAAFQFRKALALDPTHEPAQRYLGYTAGLTGDPGIADRFARLE